MVLNQKKKNIVNSTLMYMDINTYWNNFKKNNNLPDNLEYFDAFGFGISDEEIDELLNLVLIDKKKATTSIYLKEEKYPKVGDYSIVLDSKQEPRCIIQTERTSIFPFKEMTYDICKKEGEDEVLDTWVATHKKILTLDCKDYGYTFNEDMDIFFEEFKLIYK